jgi:GTP pyrophosphokinase
MKLLRNNMDMNEIYDISALRVIVDTVEQCYHVLGIVHSLYRPVPNRLKDYIANPKPNGYQSIHTAVFTGEGPIVEIQIRTKLMQYEAEYGIASHLIYEESDKPQEGGKVTKNIQWIQELIEWQKNVKESEEYLKTLKTHFFRDRIFVFTPKEDVIELPVGSTPVDFAYAIHSDIGAHTHGVRINGKFAGLDTKLKNGDMVLIETKKASHPTSRWLDFVKTLTARKHIKQELGILPIKTKKTKPN